MAFQNNKQGGKPGKATAQAPRPSSVTIAARGNAPKAPSGPTPAPTRKYVNPILTERVDPVGYANAKNLGPSSVEPGVTDTSALADELKRVNAEGDGGDTLQDVIEHGTARNSSVNLVASQTRPISDKQIAPAHGQVRQTKQSAVGDVVVGNLPATCGASAAPPDPKEPN